MSNLLCVDWDWLFPSPMESPALAQAETLALWDWGHSEHLAFLSDVLWQARAAAFHQAGVPLPQIQAPDGGWDAFWSRFTFAENLWFGYADSNTHAGSLETADGSDSFEHVVLFDAHHDSGYRIETFADYVAQSDYSCEDWMLEHQVRGTKNLTVYYPSWKANGPREALPAGALTRQVVDDGQPLTGIIFDTVFVCRSGTWVPPWCDAEFCDFINAFPGDRDLIDDMDLPRTFDYAAAQAFGHQMRTPSAPMTSQQQP